MPVRSLFRRLAGLAVLALAGCASAPPPLPTVPELDLARYLGRWHEVAALPAWFQRQCVGDTTAEYTRDGDRIAVRNRCRTADGGFDEARAVAEVQPGSGNARLRVSFLRPFWGDYWVLALDPDYRWVLVGEPSRRYAWVLARTPWLDAAELDGILERAAALGFDRQAFVRTPQRARSVQPIM